MQLENKVALVTGAALRIGRAIALALGEAGCHVVLHYGRSREEAEETAAEIRKKGVQVEPIKADLRAPDEIDALFSKVEERFQRLDVLVNSAASFKRQEFEAIGVPEWDAVQAINLRAPFLCTQRAADLMRRSRRPRS